MNDSRRNNIFKTRCLILESLCYLIVDGGGCANVANIGLVSKRSFETTPLPSSYEVQKLSDLEELDINIKSIYHFRLINIVMRFYEYSRKLFMM